MPAFTRQHGPSLAQRVVRWASSEGAGWAAQNCVGVLFTLLFTTVWRMHFTLSCVSSVLFAAASTVLSLDRTIGGRLFSASLFIGCMLSGGLIGGAISSLAWLARGESEGVAIYAENALVQVERAGNLTLSEAEQLGLISADNPLLLGLQDRLGELRGEQFIQVVGDVLKLAESEVAEEFASLAPPILTQLESDAFEALGESIPVIDTGFWALLIVLFAVVCLPLSIARAHTNFKIGLVMAISTLFCGSQVIFACLMPVTGIRLYWTQFVLGYVKVALVNAAAMVCAACLVYVKSSHDTARERFSETFKTCGVILSRIAGDINRIDVGARGSKADVATYDAECRSLRAEAIAMANATVPMVTTHATKQKCEEAAPSDEIKLPEAPTAFELRASCQTIEDALMTCLLEIPLPGMTSHVGARRADFVRLLGCLRTVLSTVCCIETIFATASLELALCGHDTAPVQYVLAAVAAMVSQASSVLATMPVLGPCKGEGLLWRPQSGQFWGELEESVAAFKTRVRDAAIAENIRLSQRGRDMMLLLMNTETLVRDARKCEALLAAALDVPVEDVEACGKEEMEAETNHEAKPESDTKTKAEKASKGWSKARIVENAYLPSLLVHSVLLSGLAQYALVVMSTINFFKGCAAFARSRAERIRMCRDVYIQFAVKFWLATTVTVMSIVLILWKAKFSSANQLQNTYDITYFFFVWQPIYFWLTVAICVQFEVEAAVMRAVLRTTMTAVGGTLGYCAMLNGNLAQNPYWICGIVCAVNGVFSLFCVLKPLRYSIFLANFTFNAVVVCQYYGCSCDLAGETNIYGGKVLSTMLGSIYAILVSWVILPFYTSQKVLDLEYEVMTDGLTLVASTWRHDKYIDRVSDATKEGTLKLDVDTVDKLVDERLVAVHKEIEYNTVAKDQLLLLTWTILPTPSVVHLLKSRLERLGVFLREFAQINVQDRDGDQSTASPEFSRCISNIYSLLEDSERAAGALMVNIRANFDASGSTELRRTRAALDVDLAALEATLDAVTQIFTKWDSERKFALCESELWAIAKSRLAMLAFKEYYVIAVLLADTEATVDRDVWYSAWSSWFGRRPIV